jgi:hypothetical protein
MEYPVGLIAEMDEVIKVEVREQRKQLAKSRARSR